MDSLPENQDSAAVLANESPREEVADKRPAENGDSEARHTKKQRTGGGGGGKLKRRVAEIVLVLSTMSRIRGGKIPTEVEIRLMAEAREKLAELCQGLAPKEMVAKDAIGAVIEDLGLNSKVKDQKLGFRGPRLTIAEKFSQAKKKMEDSRKYPSQSSSYTSQPTQTGFNPSSEIRGTSHITRPIQSDKPSYQQIPSVGPSSSSSHVGHVSMAMPTSVSYQIPTTNDVKPYVASSNLPTRIDNRPQVKMEGGPNVPSYASQGQVNSLNAHSIKPQTWSVQPQAPKTGPEQNKKPTHIPLKVDLTPQMGVPRVTPLPQRDQNFAPFVHQPSPGTLPVIHHQPIQPVNYSQASSLTNSHNEIAKIVQKLLQPKLPDHPTWIPPSRDYMNKALACQICQVTVNDVDSVLVCDACEKGYHTKCTPPTSQRGIPRGEWHCSRCLAMSNGKPLPPKYGRVMRSNTQMKVPMSSDGVQPLPEKKVGALEPKVNQQKVAEIGGFGLQNPGTEADSKSLNSKGTEKDEKPVLESCESSSLKSSEPASASSTIGLSESSGPQKTPAPTDGVGLGGENTGTEADSKSLNSKDSEKDISSSSSSVGKNIDEKPVLGNCENSSLISSKTIGLSESSAQPVNDSEPSTCKEESDELKPVATDNLSDSVINMTESSQPSQDLSILEQFDQPNSISEASEKPQDHSPAMTSPDKLKLDENSESNLMDNSKQDEQDSAHEKNAESEIMESTENSSDGSLSVEWIGDSIQVVEEKTFYSSCRVNGVVYKLQDHVHSQFLHGKSTPSKIQSMWEDGKTMSKYVHAGKYIFPSDLPETHGRPCSTDTNEVYESNQPITVIIGDIKGLCEVLPQTKFEEESQRRNQLDPASISELPPLYLCKWLYDEVKESFQPISG